MPPIYEKSVRALMHDMANDLAQPNMSFSRQQAVDWFASKYPKIKTGTVTAHLIRLSTNLKARLHYSPKPPEDDLFFQIDSSEFRRYDPKTDPKPIRSSDPHLPPDPTEEGSDGSTEFAYESDLRDYLAKNLNLLEPGLKLYEDEGITGLEFPVGGRFIDILATDSEKNLVVIELKVSRGYDRVVGQLMRYMAWIQKNQAEANQQVRGIIVAREISQDLLLACSLLKGVKLFEYQLSLALKRVDTDG